MIRIFKKQPPTMAELEQRIANINEQLENMSYTALNVREWEKLTKELKKVHADIDRMKIAN